MLSDLATVTHAEAVARLFRETALRGIRMDVGVPGRSWTAGALPQEMTALDQATKELQRRVVAPRMLPANRLAERGITCPFYFVRLGAMRAWHGARAAVTAYEGRGRIQDAIELLSVRIDAGTRLLREAGHEAHITRGNPYLERGPHPERRRIELDQALTYSGELTRSIEADTAHRAALEVELQRRQTWAGRDIWATTFFMHMGNVWTTLTDCMPPVNDLYGSESKGHFFDLLDSAVATLVSGEVKSTQKWGQAKTLRQRFGDAVPGEGFRIHQMGEMTLCNAEVLRERGPDLAVFLDMAMHEGDAMMTAVVALRDHSEEPSHVVMREIVLKRCLAPFMSLRVKAQLGWLQEPNAKSLGQAIRAVIAKATAGDALATVVVELARRAERVASLTAPDVQRRDIVWPAPFFGRAPYDLQAATAAHGDAQGGDEGMLCLALAFWPRLFEVRPECGPRGWPDSSIMPP